MTVNVHIHFEKAKLSDKRLELITSAIKEFAVSCEPLELEHLYLMTDDRTGASYCECHVRAEKIIRLATIDVPLDPDEQPEYRANREIVENHVAYARMQSDALKGRAFSNIVTEFTLEYDSSHPLKVIGGQHRYMAIQGAHEAGVNEYHGLKVYFGLDPEQRLDAQLISNTTIAVSTDLFDRMHETLMGPHLRDWCQEVGLLPAGQDFADRRQRGDPITVRAARTFVVNYYRGRSIDSKEFDNTETTPILCKSGVPDPSWEAIRKDHPKWSQDSKLREAGREYAQLIDAQRIAFAKPAKKVDVDYPEKALNYAVLSSWAYVAGVLHNNATRLKRHYALRLQTGRDPLNAAELAKGRHKTDADNYRGLGYRTDAKERGRFVELFFSQAEQDKGITKSLIDLAMKKYHAKQAVLEVKRAQRGEDAPGEQELT